MGYEAALAKAWNTLKEMSDKDVFSVSLLNETYDVNLSDSTVLTSSKTPAKTYTMILILHYIIGKIKNNFKPSQDFVSFKDIEAGEFYFSAFREGAIAPLIKKFGSDPQKLALAAKRFNGKRIDGGDIAVEIRAFEDVFIRIILWKGDEEFAPEATMLFDRELIKVYSTEDIAVFLRLIAHSL